MSEKILILEDDPAMQSFLVTLLKNHQHQVINFSSGLAALHYLKTEAVDLILLDLGLQDIDGQHWLTQLRSWSDTAVIVISARHREQDKIQALDSGAHDYVTKPFSAAELMARVRANLRKTMSGAPSLSFSDIVIDPIARTVQRAGNNIHLTKTEYDILLLLVKHTGKVLTHNFILTHIWGAAYTDRPEYIRVHIAQLRQKLEHTPANPRFLKTEPGVGYRLTFQE